MSSSETVCDSVNSVCVDVSSDIHPIGNLQHDASTTIFTETNGAVRRGDQTDSVSNVEMELCLSRNGAFPNSAHSERLNSLMEFSDEHRESTFCDWPAKMRLGRDFAKCGFVYTHEGDWVRCTVCDVQIGLWSAQDDVAERHRRYSPSCWNNNSSWKAKCFNPKHQHMKTESARIHSFDYGWTSSISSESMARAGFFYTGCRDNVECFQCGAKLNKWMATDNPSFEHARWSPSCPFIQRLIGSKQAKDANEAQLKMIAKMEAQEMHGIALGFKRSMVRDVLYKRFCDESHEYSDDKFVEALKFANEYHQRAQIESAEDRRRRFLQTIEDEQNKKREPEDLKLTMKVNPNHENLVYRYHQCMTRAAIVGSSVPFTFMPAALTDAIVQSRDAFCQVQDLDLIRLTMCIRLEQHGRSFESLGDLLNAMDEERKKQNLQRKLCTTECLLCRKNQVNAIFKPCLCSSVCMLCSYSGDKCISCFKRIETRSYI